MTRLRERWRALERVAWPVDPETRAVRSNGGPGCPTRRARQASRSAGTAA